MQTKYNTGVHQTTRSVFYTLVLFICATISAIDFANAQTKITISKDTGKIDLGYISKTIVGNNKQTEAKVKAIIKWANANLQWTANDYINRTAKEILCKGGGECAEEAKVVTALFDEAKIQWRRINEINIQPEDKGRQHRADSLVKLRGFTNSVFGLLYNDHVWLEYYDNDKKKWQPADPTTGLVGLNTWLRSRVGFGARPMNKIIATKDMLVPIFIVTTTRKDKAFDENRSSYYLITAFNSVYKNKLSALPEWKNWVRLIQDISPKCMGAFEGTVNLHQYTDEIGQIRESYLKLKDEYQKSIKA